MHKLSLFSRVNHTKISRNVEYVWNILVYMVQCLKQSATADQQESLLLASIKVDYDVCQVRCSETPSLMILQT